MIEAGAKRGLRHRDRARPHCVNVEATMIQKVDSGCADFAPEKDELSTTQENGDAPPLHPNPRRARALEAYYDLGTVIAACKRVGIVSPMSDIGRTSRAGDFCAGCS